MNTPPTFLCSLFRPRSRALDAGHAQRTKRKNMRIKNGSKGPVVRLLQEALVGVGFDINIDGVFGDRAEAAVREFQRSMGLKIDGVVGPRTASLLGVDLGDGSSLSDTADSQGTTVVFEDETVPAEVLRTIDDCAPLLSAHLNAVFERTLSALANFETTMSFASTSAAKPDTLGVLVDFAFEFGTRTVVELVPGGGLLFAPINAVRDELFRAGVDATSAPIGEWIREQRRKLEGQRGLFLESRVGEELTLFYLEAVDRPRRAAELLEVKASIGSASLPVMADLELLMYETWINAHFVRIGENDSGCIAYRFERDDDGIIFLSLTVEAPQASTGQIEGALNELFDSGTLTLASIPIEMFVRKQACFKTKNFVGGTGFFCGWLTTDNKTLHTPLKEEETFEGPAWRQAARRFTS